MKKYKLLKYSQCYINKRGNFIICLIRGNKRLGYIFTGSHSNLPVILGTFQLMSRIIFNNGNWIKIDPNVYNITPHYISECNINSSSIEISGDETIISKLQSFDYPPPTNYVGFPIPPGNNDGPQCQNR